MNVLFQNNMNAKINKKIEEPEPQRPDYTNQETLREYEQYIKHIVTFMLVKRAYELFRTLPDFLAEIPDFEKKYKSLYEGYMQITSKASFVALPMLKDNEVIDIFEKKFKDILEISDVNIMEQIESKLANILLHEERDVLKRKLRGALERNKQVLTAQPFTSEGKEVNATIGEWIRKYVSEVGNKPAERLKKQDFFFNSPYMKELSESEKEKVVKMLEVYERLKLSSVTMEGLDEPVSVITPDGKHRVLHRGRLEEVPNDNLYWAVKLYSEGKITQEEALAIRDGHKVIREDGTVVDRLEGVEESSGEQTEEISNDRANQILDAYKGDDAFNRKVARQESSLAKLIGQDNKKLRDEFYKAVQSKKAERVIAIMRLMIQLDDLHEFLTEDEKLKNYLAAVFGQVFGAEEADEFKKSPASGQSIQMFVQYILQERLGMNENDAARVGMQLSNLFKQKGKNQYGDIAYFDMGSKSFKWMEK